MSSCGMLDRMEPISIVASDVKLGPIYGRFGRLREPREWCLSSMGIRTTMIYLQLVGAMRGEICNSLDDF